VARSALRKYVCAHFLSRAAQRGSETGDKYRENEPMVGATPISATDFAASGYRIFLRTSRDANWRNEPTRVSRAIKRSAARESRVARSARSEEKRPGGGKFLHGRADWIFVNRRTKLAVAGHSVAFIV